MNTSALDQLKSCKDLKDLANLLKIPTKNLGFIVFNAKNRNAYTTFMIQKKGGGKREIHAPSKNLKKVQKSLSIILNDCFNIIEKRRIDNKNFHPSIVSHGFKKKFKFEIPTSKSNRKCLKEIELRLGIYSNALKHRNKKFVLNIDLKDFFHSINFSRIVGYFCKNEHFLLEKNIAIIIAQIATFRKNEKEEGFLPQGSPCSPIISNLIGGILDNRLNQLSKKYNCTYSRYVDDLTFSTNMNTFPMELFDQEKDMIGLKLKKIIKDSWFELNKNKTRLTLRDNRQEVTGLTVNKKVNISKVYYRNTRSMIHNYCITGEYQKSEHHSKQNINNVIALAGIINHIFYIKKYDYQPLRKFRTFDQLDSLEKLYIRFHFHKEVIHNPVPHIICEGITDPLHLKNAFKWSYPKTKNPYLINSIENLKPLHNVMGVSNGTDCMIKFLIERSKVNKSKVHNQNVCIFLVDGDKDGTSFINGVTKFYKQNKLINFSDLDILTSFNLLRSHHLVDNIYLAQLPENECIEQLYDSSILDLELNGKTFNPSNDTFDKNTFYGKKELIKDVIKPLKDKPNFSKFKNIFNTFDNIQRYHLKHINK